MGVKNVTNQRTDGRTDGQGVSRSRKTKTRLPSGRGGLRLSAWLFSKSGSKWVQAKCCSQVRPVLLREESEIQETQRHVNVVIESFFISALFIESPAVMSEDGGNGEWCYFVSTSEAAKARRAKRMESLSILAAAQFKLGRG